MLKLAVATAGAGVVLFGVFRGLLVRVVDAKSLTRWLGTQMGAVTKLLSRNPSIDALVSHLVSPIHALHFCGSLSSISLGILVARSARFHFFLEEAQLSFDNRIRTKVSIFLAGLLGGFYFLGKMTRHPLRLASISLARFASPLQSRIAIEERHECYSSLDSHLHSELILIVLEYLGDTEAEIQRIALKKIIQDREVTEGRVRANLRFVADCCETAMANIVSLIRIATGLR